MQTLTRNQSRELDRRAINEFGVPGIVLMENAGRSVADYLLARNPRGLVLICCGKGNNGGDGFVIARHLDNHRIPVQVLLCATPEELKGDAKTNFNIIMKSGLPITDLSKPSIFDEALKTLMTNAKWIIDALLGTGLSGSVQAPFDKIIAQVNAAVAHILSVDIPSGLDCDTGEPLGIAVKAQHTVTFSAMKKGFICPAAKEYLGDVHIADIGIPVRMIEEL